ncbi:MAG: hypothetical protein IT359_15045 [Gemmatimonadaceae bacterium]|nr:hypothetical protein [Gemmatimonadaceae bacterium]
MRRIRPILLIASLALAACREAVPPWGNTFEVAKRNADNAFAAFAFRFYLPQRDARFGIARTRMGRYALIPSRLFSDSAIWSTMSPDSVRALYVQGALTERGYQFTARQSAAYPDRVGDERHFLQLTRLGARGSDDYEWITHVDHAIGPVRAPQAGAAIGALFTAFEGVSSSALLAESRTTFARTARHLGQLFTIDSLRTTALADGSTSFALHVTISPDSLRGRYPSFARYLDKYLMESRARLQLTDRAGATYADLAIRDGRWTTRLRARDGRLVSLAGQPRPMPDSLRLRVDATARFMIFRVGFHDLVGDFTIERGEHTRAWAMQFRREPQWDLPLATERLIRSPLRRPFEGRGSELRLAIRDDLGNQAMSVRQIRTAVRESAIMRWLGGLGASAFGDFTGSSEVEENRFLYEMFSAMRLDVAALTAAP